MGGVAAQPAFVSPADHDAGWEYLYLASEIARGLGNLEDRYALSDDTRAKGMKDLLSLGLITVRRQPVNPDDFDLERVRNTYTLDLDALTPPPPRTP